MPIDLLWYIEYCMPAMTQRLCWHAIVQQLYKHMADDIQS